MERISKATEDLIKAIHESDSHKNYEVQKEKVRRMPDLKRKIDDFRQQSFLLQNNLVSLNKLILFWNQISDNAPVSFVFCFQVSYKRI